MLGLGISLVSGGFAGSPFVSIVNSFVARVNADGGTVEAFNCTVEKLRSLPDADFGRVTWDAYSVRVLADAGTLEGRDCVIAAVNEIDQINAI